jgi:S1-C subfamily serine protease
LTVFRIVLLLVVCLLPLTGVAGLPDTVERIRGAVVGIGKAYPPKQPLPKKAQRMTFRGTGFAVADGLHIITNHHVLPASIDTDNREMLAVFSGRGNASRMHPARVVAVDEAHDLALLAIAGPALPVFRLGPDSVREGSAIAITGFPIGVVLGLYPVTHSGIVAAITPMARPAENARQISGAHLRRMRDDDVSYQLDIVAYPGNSGSPVYLPDSGQLIGVLNSVVVKETRESLLQNPSGISYAIPLSYVRALMAGAGLAP